MRIAAGSIELQPSVPPARSTAALERLNLRPLDRRDREGCRPRAKTLGAAAHHLVDARAEYFDRVLKFLIYGNVRRGGLYPLCVGAERAVQAQEVALAAARLGSTTIAHGCTGAGNDQVRFEVALRALAPDVEILVESQRARAGLSSTPVNEEQIEPAEQRLEEFEQQNCQN